MGPLLVAHGITCELSNGRRLFERLNFSLPAGITGLVGPNGVGKTCLAHILAGRLAPSAGSVQRRVAVTLLAQREPPPGLPVAECLAELDRHSPVRAALLEGIDTQAPCDALSGGQWMRVRLARVLDDSFLILDEPSNDLDGDARAILLRFLHERRGGTLLISHDRQCLELCSGILELSNRGLSVFGGGWAGYSAARDAERGRLDDALAVARREREAARAQMREQAQRRSRQQGHAGARAARGGMPKLVLGMRKRQAQRSDGGRAAATAAKADEAVRTAAEAFAALKLQPVMYAGVTGCGLPGQKLVAEAQEFNIRRRDWIYARDLNFSWRGSVRVAIQGTNGSGKSTLLQAIRGGHFSTRGRLHHGDVPTVFLDQRHSGLRDELSILQNITQSCPGSEAGLRNTLAQFLFRGDSVHQPVGTLSGGERLRTALAQAFLQVGTAELMLLDEPTNNLDAANVEFLEDIVRQFRGALLVVSHDQRFLERCGVQQEYMLTGRPR